MDAVGVTLACATSAEARVARRLGASAAVIGVRARHGLPAGPLVSFGLAGGLHDGLELGEVLDATRVVDERGEVLWEGEPLRVPGARLGTILATGRVVDDPAERRRLHERTGADAVDMESGPLARSGQLRGCLRSISDTPSRTLGPLAETLGPDGRLAWAGLARALASPVRTGRALGDLRRALRRLEEVAA
jgi:nucleoside phosphorylase